jgi:UDP-2,4-diacetamido-2,4,6-trideoxy-beta-L-altropyranose hydrolase
LLVRADASATIGGGHVMRCLALAEAWRKVGGSALFACREHPGHLAAAIEAAGFEVAMLPLRQAPDEAPYAGWLGAGWSEDAEDTLALIEAMRARPDWLVVDHYALDRRWEQRVRAGVAGLLVIDDLADRTHAPCLLLDQNLVADLHSRYAGHLAEPSRLLLGPRYALLRDAFARTHELVQPRSRPPRRVLVNFGGGKDAQDIAGRTLRALQSLGLPGLEIDLVAGDRHAARLRASAAASPGVRVHATLPSLAGLACEADFAIGGCGISAWERLCLGLPSLVVTMAPNQRASARELERLGLVRWLGDHETLDDAALAAGIAAAVASLPDPDWSSRCLAMVDGKGAERVVAAMAQGAPPALRARRAGTSDEQRLLDWANDPLTRANAFSPRAITPD